MINNIPIEILTGTVTRPGYYMLEDWTEAANQSARIKRATLKKPQKRAHGRFKIYSQKAVEVCDEMKSKCSAEHEDSSCINPVSFAGLESIITATKGADSALNKLTKRKKHAKKDIVMTISIFTDNVNSSMASSQSSVMSSDTLVDETSSYVSEIESAAEITASPKVCRDASKLPTLDIASKVYDSRSIASNKSKISCKTENTSMSSISRFEETKKYIIQESDLPQLPITPQTKSKYFGPTSKQDFYSTFKYLDNKRKNYLDGDNDIQKLIKNPLGDVVSQARSFLHEYVEHNLDEDEEDDQYYNEHTSSYSRKWNREDSRKSSTSSRLKGKSLAIITSDYGNDFEKRDGDGDGDSAVCADSTLSMLSQSVDHNSAYSLGEEMERSDISIASFAPESPRALYLAGCISQNLPPRSAMLLRNRPSTALWLDHQGMGDKRAMLLSQGLNNMPLIHSINLTDNNLTDIGLTALINTISTNPSIKEVYLSQNVIDDKAAAALAKYLSAPNCAIEKLILQSANVDDSECHRFVTALKHNKSLHELDMSCNLLGKDENLNAVKPDIVTAGESIAELLRAGICPMTTLKISWNLIRMSGAVDLCSSISMHKTLRHLDLSYNAIGREGGLALGSALLENKVIEELNIASNNIDAVACVTIAIGVRECLSLKNLIIDGNAIGEAGGQMLMTLPLTCGPRIQFSCKSCNVTMVQPACWFNVKGLTGETINLDMENSYERAVFYEILDIVAKSSSLEFKELLYEDSPNSGWTKLDMIRVDILKQSHEISDDDVADIQRMKNIISLCTNSKFCIQCFKDCDIDFSGELNEDEFNSVIDRIGFDLSEDQRADIMATYDNDNSGNIQLEEFMEFLVEMKTDYERRVRDTETIARCALKLQPDNRFIPPKKGKFKMLVLDTYVQSANGRAVTILQSHQLLKGAKASSNVGAMLALSVKNEKLRFQEAELLFNAISKDSGDPATALCIILPQMIATTDATKLLLKTTRSDPAHLKRIQQVLGNAYGPLLGICDGYYSLDFRNEMDRLCMMKLLEMSTSNASMRQNSGLGDVSQDGNWSGFRNEYCEGVEIFLTKEFLTPIPKVGKIEFDFVSSLRPLSSASLTNDRKIISILQASGILGKSSASWAHEQLTYMKKLCKRSLSCYGGACIYKPDKGRMIQASQYLYDNLYTKLSDRSKQNEKAAKRESYFLALMTNISNTNAIVAQQIGGEDFDNLMEDDSAGNDEGRFTIAKMKSSDSVDMSTARDEVKSNAIVSTVSSITKKAKPAPPPKKKKDKDAQLAYANGNKACIQCMQTISALQKSLMNRWILCSHLALIVQCFSFGTLKKTDFGTYRVELIVMLFGRIKDLHNFELVLSCIQAEEHGMLLARLGYLNLMNSMKPEGCYVLDLKSWEQKQVAKILVHLGKVEPGTNWIDESFCFDRGVTAVPGWSLPINWLAVNYTATESENYNHESINGGSGVPNKGILTLEYYSGSGVNFMGCAPERKIRQVLLSLTLLQAESVMFDDESQLTPITIGKGSPSMKCTLEESNRMLRNVNIGWTYDGVHSYHL